MHYTPELGSRKTDVQAAREAEGVTAETRFINYGRVGDEPVDAGTLSDISNAWAARGVIGTSEVPHHKLYARSEVVINCGPAVTVSEALAMIKTHADEAAGQLAVGNAVAYAGRWDEDTQVDTVEVRHPALIDTDEAA